MTEEPAKRIEVQITASAFQGVGVARVEGKVILVDRAVQGDHLLVEITEEKKNFCRARPVSVLSKNALRLPSPCEISSQCRGCPWIEIPYPTQLEWKKQILTESLKRLGKISFSAPIEVVASPELFNYRNRITLRGFGNENSAIQLGYIGDHQLPLPIKKCQIAAESINHFLMEWEKLTAKLPCCDEAIEFRMEIQESPLLRENHNRCLLISIKPLKGSASTYANLIKCLSDHQSVASCGFEDSFSTPLPFEAVAQNQIHYTYPGLFQQVNLGANNLMRKKIIQWVEGLEVKQIWDLYCGSGNLSLALLNQGRNLVGVEINPQSIECARHAVKQNQIVANSDFIAGSVYRFLKEQLKRGHSADLIIVDPPRAGVKEEIQLISKIKPDYLILVSCNPTTLARDLTEVVSHDYQIQQIALFDFFPHSYHFETLCLAARTESGTTRS